MIGCSYAPFSPSDPLNGSRSSAASKFYSAKGDQLIGSVYSDAQMQIVYQSYYETYCVTVNVYEAFSCEVGASARARLWYGEDDGSSMGTCEAFADPMIEIDPSYPYKGFYSLEFSENITPPPPNPVVISKTDVTNGCVTFQFTCPSNHVCEVQATTNLVTPDWQVIAVVTNSSGAVDFADGQTLRYPQRFYRARVIKKVQ